MVTKSPVGEIEPHMELEIPQKLLIVRHHFRGRRFDGCRILDVGGCFYYHRLLNEIFRFGEVILINLDETTKGTANGVRGDGTKLPFKNESLDVVTSFDTIEHVSEPDELVMEVHRVLKNDGTLILSSPNLADLYSRVVFLLGYMPFQYNPSKIRPGSPLGQAPLDMSHKSVLTFRALQELVVAYGFRIERSYGYCGVDPFTNARICLEGSAGLFRTRRFLNRILPNTLREETLLVCTKHA
jgi:SAM-dependent methyltransferase